MEITVSTQARTNLIHRLQAPFLYRVEGNHGLFSGQANLMLRMQARLNPFLVSCWRKSRPKSRPVLNLRRKSRPVFRLRRKSRPKSRPRKNGGNIFLFPFIAFAPKQHLRPKSRHLRLFPFFWEIIGPQFCSAFSREYKMGKDQC